MEMDMEIGGKGGCGIVTSHQVIQKSSQHCFLNLDSLLCNK